jgi:hypothetical protein
MTTSAGKLQQQTRPSSIMASRFLFGMLLLASFADVHGFVVVNVVSQPKNKNNNKSHALACKSRRLLLPVLSASSSSSSSSSPSKDNQPDFFKAGLLANMEQEAAILASKKIKSIQDLGYKNPPKRPATIRPKYWAWGGADELAIQDKANYDTSNKNPNCPEAWVSLSQFYTLIDDDTAVADTIFVALAGGRAFIERDVAEQVLQQWWRYPPNNNKNKKNKRKSFDTAAFLKTVQKGRQDFLLGWGSFLAITGFAMVGIVFPTNPLQLALVNALDVVIVSTKQ